MSYDRETFVRQVLTDMGVVAAGETPSAEDAALIEQRTDQTFESLYEEGLLPFDIDGDIPARYMAPLAALVALEAYGAYGFFDRAMYFADRAGEGRKQLWRLRQKPVADIPTRATFY